MKNLLVLTTLACLLLIVVAANSTSKVETAAQTAGLSTPEPTPTLESRKRPYKPESTEGPYILYSGYYRIRCWPGCHTKDIPESLKRKRPYKPESTEGPYILYSGYYRIRCWPGCHTKDIPESIRRKAY
jgi:hypothetical protein